MMGYFKNIINDINRVSDALPESSVSPMKADALSKYESHEYESSKYKNSENNSTADKSVFKQSDALNEVNDNLHSENININAEVVESRLILNESIPNEQNNNSCNENNDLYQKNKNNSILIPNDKKLENNEVANKAHYFNDGENKEDETVLSDESIKSPDNVEFENKKNNKVFDDVDEKILEPVFYENVKNNIDDLQNNIKSNEYRSKIIDATDLGCQYNNDKDETFSQEIIKSPVSSRHVRIVSEKRLIDEGGVNETGATFYNNRQADVNVKEGNGLHEKNDHPVPVSKTRHEIDDREQHEVDYFINETVMMRSKFTEVNADNKKNKLGENNISEHKYSEGELNINKPDKNKSNENKLSKKAHHNQPLVENTRNIKKQKENSYKVAGEKQSLGAADKKIIERPEKRKNRNLQKEQKLVPDVIIGQIDIKIETPPVPVAQSDSSSAMLDLSSRYYLRHL